MDIKGVFSTIELSEQEKNIFAEYLQHSMNTPIIEFVRYLLGDDYLKFIDILSGTTFKIPSSKSLERDLEFVRIYLYVSRRGFTEEAFKMASKSFNKTAITVKRIVLKVSKTLGVEDTLEGDALANYYEFLHFMEALDKSKEMASNCNKTSSVLN